MNTRFYLSIVTVVVTAVFVSCATPVPPTGGPPDSTRPVIENTDPANETVNFDGRRVRISFSKFMNRGSLANALEIEPDLAIGYDISWGRRSVTIEFDQDLPDNTTVIIKIGTDMSDTNNNNLASQFELALSTGPEIDDGRVTGRVLQAGDGQAADPGHRVFLYREPFDLSARANYVAQADTAGVVQFSYLAEDSYRAIWVDDANRNRIWEQERELAQPFFDSTFTLEAGDEFDMGTIYIDRPDTVRPELRGVGLLTGNRLRMRFSESVYWDEGSLIEVTDTLGNAYTEAYPLYIHPTDPLVLLAQTGEPLEEEHVFDMRLSGITDRAGNEADVRITPFSGSSQPDTVRLAIIGDNLDPGLFPDEPVVIAYNKWIEDENVRDSLKVVQGESMIEEWPHVEIDRHRLIIRPDGQWESGITHQFLAWNPATELLRPFEPLIWQRNQLGSLEITLEDTSDTEEHFLILYDDEGKVRVDTTFTRQLELEQLPPLSYTVIVFRDTDGSGSWNPGNVIPFEAPEPYYVRRNIPVREGFTSELNVSFENWNRP